MKDVPDKFTASFFCSTDTANNQIASFYTGAMAHAAELSFRTAGAGRSRDHLAERSGGDDAVRRGVPHARHPRSSSIPASSARACRATSCATGIDGRAHRHLQRLRARADSPEDRLGETEILDAREGAGRHARRARVVGACDDARRVDVPAVTPRPHRRSDRRRRRVSRRLHEGPRARRRPTTCARGSAASRRPIALEHLGGTSHAYTWEEFQRAVRAALRRAAL